MLHICLAPVILVVIVLAYRALIAMLLWAAKGEERCVR